MKKLTEDQKRQLFIKACLTEKDLAVLSVPIMNTNHQRLFDVFCQGLALGGDI